MKQRIPARRVRASITIYISLVLLLIMVLVCTLIESGRVSAISAKLEGVTYLGMDSVFSEFAAPVFEDYGVMMLWCKDDEFVRRMDKYISYNIKNTGLSLKLPADLYRIEHEETMLTATDRATDEKGRLFADQVYEYMKYVMPENMAEELLGDAGIFDEGNKVNEFMDEINKHKKTFLAVEKSATRLKDKLEKIQDRARDPLNALKDLSSSTGKYKDSGNDRYINDINKANGELKKTKKELTFALEGLQKETDKYHENVEKAQAAAGEIENNLSVSKADLSDDVYENLQKEIEEIKIKSGETEADFYNAEKTGELIIDYKGRLDSLESLTSMIDSGVTKENAAAIDGEAAAFEEAFKDFDLQKLSVNLDLTKVNEEDSKFLDEIQSIFDKGVLGYIAPEISDRKVDVKGLPSGDPGSGGEKKEKVSSAAVNKALFSEYIRTLYSSYTKHKEDNALLYEQEYILAGKASDRDNLKKVIDEIVLLRTGCNIVSLIGDAQKKGEAMALAVALVGFTGLPIIIKLTQLIILGTWALAEAIVDAKLLLEGEKVPVIKKNNEWTLSVSGLKKFASSGATGKKIGTGIKYEDYLRALLLMQDKTKQRLRCLDVIQLNMIKKENKDFRIKDCILAAEVNVSYSAKEFFTAFPFVRRYLGYEGGKYVFDVAQRYIY